MQWPLLHISMILSCREWYSATCLEKRSSHPFLRSWTITQKRLHKWLCRKPTALSTVLSGSQKGQCLDTFLKEGSRAAYGLLPMLEQSLLSSESSFHNEESLEETGKQCRCGCKQIRRGLGAFEAVEHHNFKTYTTYMRKGHTTKAGCPRVTQWLVNSVFNNLTLLHTQQLITLLQ